MYQKILEKALYVGLGLSAVLTGCGNEQTSSQTPSGLEQKVEQKAPEQALDLSTPEKALELYKQGLTKNDLELLKKVVYDPHKNDFFDTSAVNELLSKSSSDTTQIITSSEFIEHHEVGDEKLSRKYSKVRDWARQNGHTLIKAKVKFKDGENYRTEKVYVLKTKEGKYLIPLD